MKAILWPFYYIILFIYVFFETLYVFFAKLCHTFCVFTHILNQSIQEIYSGSVNKLPSYCLYVILPKNEIHFFNPAKSGTGSPKHTGV